MATPERLVNFDTGQPQAVKDMTGFITLISVAVPTNANAAAAGVPLGGLYVSTADPATVYVRTV